VKQFEEQYTPDHENPNAFVHHEKSHSAQKTFRQQVVSLTDVFKKMGNPFLDNFRELVAADSRDCADPSVAESLRNLEKTGIQQYEAFVDDVLVKRTKSINDTIRKNKISLFKQPRNSNPSKQGRQIAALKTDVSIFSQLYIALQIPQEDIKDFFSNEVHKYPPSISEYGRLRLPSSKSDLLKCLPQSGDAQCLTASTAKF
jgi:hypothetical protein